MVIAARLDLTAETTYPLIIHTAVFPNALVEESAITVLSFRRTLNSIEPFRRSEI